VINIETFIKKELKKYHNTLKYSYCTGVDKIDSDRFESILDQQIEIILSKYFKRTYRFTRFKKIKTNNQRIVSIPTIRDRLVLEFLNRRIIEKFKVHFPNRDKITYSIIQKLNEQLDYHVIRLDIKDFFNSIPQNKLLQKLKESSLLSSEEYYLVKEMLKLIPNGVPQGISISNTLADIYLEGFDYKLKRIHPRISLYSRYVDDILILVNGSLSSFEKNEIDKKITNVFKYYGFQKNDKKEKHTSFIKSSTTFQFDYLGYSYSIKNNKLYMSISPDKYSKILKKVDFCFRDYQKNKNINLLEERLNLLTSKIIMNKIKDKKSFFSFGIIESYKRINHEEWEKLNEYLKLKLTSNRKQGLLSRKEFRTLYTKKFERNGKKLRFIKMYSFSKNDYIKKIRQIDNNIKYQTLLSKSLFQLTDLYFRLIKI
jgi:retron-type reverse transcriptase